MEIVIDEHMLCLVGRSVVGGWALQGVGIVSNIALSFLRPALSFSPLLCPSTTPVEKVVRS